MRLRGVSSSLGRTQYSTGLVSRSTKRTANTIQIMQSVGMKPFVRGFRGTLAALEGTKGSAADNASTEQNKSLAEFDYDEYDDFDEEPQTAAGKVRMVSRLIFQLGFALGAAYCIYYLGKDLLPHKAAPFTMFGNSFDVLRTNAELQKMIGEDMRAYGRVGGGKSVESRTYTHSDGSERTRIRYTIEGRRGKCTIWCEMSDNLEDTEEFVYLICKVEKTGRVLTIHDNRSKLDELAAKGAGNAKQKGLISEFSNLFK